MNQFDRYRKQHLTLAGRFAGSLTLAVVVSMGIAIGASATETTTLDPLEVMKARGCIACHIIPGIPEAQGKMGPSLKGLNERKRIVARTLTNNEKNMRRWLKNPKKVKSDTLMPNIGLTDEEIESLIEYFRTL